MNNYYGVIAALCIVGLAEACAPKEQKNMTHKQLMIPAVTKLNNEQKV